MFRVPTSADAPTFDHTETVGFWRWLASGSADRAEWARRRNAAAEVAAAHQHAAVRAAAATVHAKAEAGKQRQAEAKAHRRNP